LYHIFVTHDFSTPLTDCYRTLKESFLFAYHFCKVFFLGVPFVFLATDIALFNEIQSHSMIQSSYPIQSTYIPSSTEPVPLVADETVEFDEPPEEEPDQIDHPSSAVDPVDGMIRGEPVMV